MGSCSWRFDMQDVERKNKQNKKLVCHCHQAHALSPWLFNPIPATVLFMVPGRNLWGCVPRVISLLSLQPRHHWPVCKPAANSSCYTYGKIRFSHSDHEVSSLNYFRGALPTVIQCFLFSFHALSCHNFTFQTTEKANVFILKQHFQKTRYCDYK